LHEGAIERISDNSPDASLGRLGYDSEWDFVFFHQLKETMYNNVDLNALFRAMEESQNRVKYIMSHDEIGNYDGTRLVSKLMVPMLSLNENIVLDDEDNHRANQMSELKNIPYEQALNNVKNQKAQLACEQLLKQFLTGKFDEYNKSETGFYWFEPVDERFIQNVLIPLGIKPESGICPEKVQEMYSMAFSLSKAALSLTYSVPGPKMVFQGDEKADITPFRFFRKFQSSPDDNRNLYIEKGYNTGLMGVKESTLGKIKYSKYAQEKTDEYKALTSDLNKIASENKAMNDGHYVYEDTIKHYQSKLLATHTISEDETNELFTISNFEHVAYPRKDADKYYIRFPKGKWVEILNTDDKKYGGVGYVNHKLINANGNSDIPINVGKYSTLIFKKIS
jgi:1,4-alpha-glucan branching enzyme